MKNKPVLPTNLNQLSRGYKLVDKLLVISSIFLMLLMNHAFAENIHYNRNITEIKGFI